MGCYDTVYFKCPTCSKQIEKQTKAGNCLMDVYSSDYLPIQIAMEFEGAEVFCHHCNAFYKVVSNIPKVIECWLVPKEKKTTKGGKNNGATPKAK